MVMEMRSRLCGGEKRSDIERGKGDCSGNRNGNGNGNGKEVVDFGFRVCFGVVFENFEVNLRFSMWFVFERTNGSSIL